MDASNSGVLTMDGKSIENYGEFLRNATVKALSDYFSDVWDGSKFFGSLGPVSSWTFVDYWTLRRRSMELFRTNIYAKGIIRRLVWNEIHTGIVATPAPMGAIIFPDMNDVRREELAIEWGDKIAQQFELYSSTPTIFDWGKKETFGAFQARVRMESLISGDGIIISRIDAETKLPRWQWVNGDHIRTPDNFNCEEGHVIKHGVEFDHWGRRVAYYVQSEAGGEFRYERIPTRGKKSGRLISWMVYGGEHFVDDVRGEPFLSDSIYMLKDLDRTRDAEVRASLVNAMIPLFLEEGPNHIQVGARPSDLMRVGAKPAAAGNPPPPMNGVVEVTPPTDKLDIMNPGTIYHTPSGGKISSFQTNRPNVNYSAFEKSIVSVLAWSHGLPPEILMLEFGSNYSASRQANNEFEVYLGRFMRLFAGQVTQPIYDGWIEQIALTGQLPLPGFMKAYGDKEQWRTISAWKQCTWTGLNRPSVDRSKEATASQILLDNGLTTYDIEARRHSGLSFPQVMQTIKRERELMDRMGFVPHTLEDNNGNPAYLEKSEGEE